MEQGKQNEQTGANRMLQVEWNKWNATGRMEALLVGVFEPSQPLWITSGQKENLRNEIQLKGPYRQK